MSSQSARVVLSAPPASASDIAGALLRFSRPCGTPAAISKSSRLCTGQWDHVLSFSSASGLSPTRRHNLHRHASSSAAVAFSTASAMLSSKKRQSMRAWFNGYGAQYKPVKASAARKAQASSVSDGENEFNGDDSSRRAPVLRPFPDNPFFRSQPVLGEDTRELVWDKVIRRGESIKAVAAELSIDMRRVAAVVRLKQVEKSWLAEGKKLAKPYSQAVLSMLPQTNYGPRDAVQPHEPINEIHVHSYTMQQLFFPVSESRQFTREDAARAFHPTMLSADKRVPVPELIRLERDVLTGKLTPEESFHAFRTKAAEEQERLVQQDKTAAAREHARTVRVDNGRFEFRIRDINAEDVGRNGRSPRAIGWRYGVPFHDRKRGQVKIPTSVG